MGAGIQGREVTWGEPPIAAQRTQGLEQRPRVQGGEAQLDGAGGRDTTRHVQNPLQPRHASPGSLWVSRRGNGGWKELMFPEVTAEGEAGLEGPQGNGGRGGGGSGGSMAGGDHGSGVGCTIVISPASRLHPLPIPPNSRSHRIRFQSWVGNEEAKTEWSSPALT